MTYEETAGPWPLLARLAMMKGGGHRGRGRYSRIDDLERLAALRHMRGGPFGGGPFGGGPFGGGRGRRRRGDVRLALLMLLAEEPRNGYQLMQAIEERSEGLWRPSPGSVYPTLAQLEDEGLIRSADVEGARRFELTDSGRKHLSSRADEPAPWESGEETAENPLAELAPLVIAIGNATLQVASVGNPAQRAQARTLLQESRRALYRILADEAHDTDEDEDQTEL